MDKKKIISRLFVCLLIIPLCSAASYTDISVEEAQEKLAENHDAIILLDVHNSNTSEDFTTIQAAIDALNTSNGHTIMVDPGTYNENVKVYKQLTVRSTTGNSTDTIVQAANTSDHVFEVTVDLVTIRGFTTKNATGSDKAGIYLGCNASHCNIAGNNATQNNIGIWLHDSSSNMLAGNIASNNSLGIYLQDSGNNTMSDNAMFDNTRNFNVYSGYALSSYLQHIDTSNRVEEKPVYYWVGRQNQVVPNDAGFVGIVNSTNITVRDVIIPNNGQGVLFAYTKDSKIENVSTFGNAHGILLSSSSNNILTNNTAYLNNCGIYLYSSSSSNNSLTDNIVTGNRYGIWMQYSTHNTLVNNLAHSNNIYGIWLYSLSSNTLSENTIKYNGRNGIYLYSSSNNTIYNNYFNNTNNAYDDGNNTWNIAKTAGTNIIGGPYLGGNYWSDYTGEDSDGDGIGDTQIPYNSSGSIENGGDWLPLVMAAP